MSKKNERNVASWDALMIELKKIKEEWNNPPALWYRGHTCYDYELVPSLFRFHGGLEKERELFNEFVKFIKTIDVGYDYDDWYILFNMQHFGIPTRLLDWTEVFGIAAFFAVTGNTDGPCIFVLNPEMLNTQSGEPLIIGVPNEYNFEYKKRFWFGYPEAVIYPKAITPVTYSNLRIQRQRGTFTIHGNCEDPLEELRPDCVIKIVLKDKAPGEAKQYLRDFNLNMFSLFPDTQGLTTYIRHQVELKPLDRIDIIFEKTKRKLNRDIDDFRKYLDGSNDVRADESGAVYNNKPSYPFSPDIVSACKLRDDFIERDTDIKALNIWLTSVDNSSIAFLTGEAGIGKTNLLLHWILYHLSEQSPGQRKPVLFYQLRNYDSKKTSLPIDLLKKIFPNEEIFASQKIAFEENIRKGKILIILDGLDELARTKGSQEALASINELKNFIGDNNEARILISCRDHIFNTLSQLELPKYFKNVHKIHLDFLPQDIVMERIKQKLKDVGIPEPASNIINHLIDIACHPLYLDVVVDMLKYKSKELKQENLNKSKLYDLWFDFVLKGYSDLDPGETKRLIARTAGAMLDKRTDVISTEELERWGLTDAEKILSKLSSDEQVKKDNIQKELGNGKANPNAAEEIPVKAKIFAQVSTDSKGKSWAFMHQSLREFILAWSVYQEIFDRKNGPKNGHIGVLSGTSAFDYESQETYCYLAELFDSDISFATAAIETIERMCPDQSEYSKYDQKKKLEIMKQWNHVVRNLFEAIGMIATDKNSKKFEKIIIPRALEILMSDEYKGLYVRFRTKFDIVRCLERLHPFAPKPYHKYFSNHKEPRSDSIYAFAVRGFQSANLKIGSFPPLIFTGSRRPAESQDIEKKVSNCLIGIIESMKAPEIAEFANYLRINCSFALIRWFPGKPEESDLDRIDELLSKLDLNHEITLNLFYTLYRRFGDKIPPLFNGKFNMINLTKLNEKYVPGGALDFLKKTY